MKNFLLVLMFFVPALLFAAIGDTGISVAPDGTELKWEEGNWDFFIMHKTALERSPENKAAAIDPSTGEEMPNNPQADTLINQNIGSTYTLTSKHIPEDAEVDRAFLIWLADQDPDNMDGNTDNSVILSFTNASDPSITLTKTVTASIQGDLGLTQKGDFEYEAVRDTAHSELKTEKYCPGATANYFGVYTYRVDVSAFMKEIIAKGKAKGMNSGTALYGNYTVKGIESSDHCYYLKQSAMTGGWALPLIYKSSHVFAKKIYFYHGLENYRFQESSIKVSGFELPEEAYIKLGLVAFEGDPGMANSMGSGVSLSIFGEGLSISGQQDPENYQLLFNKCNPQKNKDSYNQDYNYTEIFNSISSIYGWKDHMETCIGNPDNPLDPTNPIEYAIDNDTFLVNTKISPFDTMFFPGDTEFNLKIGANQDAVYTNFLIVSVDTYRPEYGSDIQPGELTGPCYDDGTCDAGLVCENYECVKGSDTNPGDNNDTDSSDTDSDSEDTDTANTDTATDTDTADTDIANTDTAIDTESADSDTTNTDSTDSGEEYGSDIQPGELTGPCYDDGTCDAGLVCKNYHCVEGDSGCSALMID